MTDPGKGMRWPPQPHMQPRPPMHRADPTEHILAQMKAERREGA